MMNDNLSEGLLVITFGLMIIMFAVLGRLTDARLEKQARAVHGRVITYWNGCFSEWAIELPDGQVWLDPLHSPLPKR